MADTFHNTISASIGATEIQGLIEDALLTVMTDVEDLVAMDGGTGIIFALNGVVTDNND